ncbi:hypothetical protein KDL01_13000 [Actinospica durhamensis]|uniref:Uncharacterized protein n=1 Tax=Actinospica durhamensis TaxID=1508375 RepID=A0A941EN85_9ACTN|nr:hypothetical protein [Actinospica durhamensis]MBR7834186.1 hypothetical protein [Actinospica durhamensis]
MGTMRRLLVFSAAGRKSEGFGTQSAGLPSQIDVQALGEALVAGHAVTLADRRSECQRVSLE